MPTYDVFLSHNSADESAVEAIAKHLRDAGLRPFLAKWHLVPGEPWVSALPREMQNSSTVAVFFGPQGMGAWHGQEAQLALIQSEGTDERRVIPVLLPGANLGDIEGFLTLRTYVDLGKNDGMVRLVAGITGHAPDLLQGFQLGPDLVRRLGEHATRPPAWSLEAIRQSWPQAFQMDQPITVVGDFDRDGNLVEGSEELVHVAEFFSAHPDGLCFVRPQLSLRFQHADIEDDQGSKSIRTALHSRGRIAALPSVSVLLARLGIETEDVSMSVLFAAARNRCDRLTDWTGRERTIAELAPLPLEQHSRYSGRWGNTTPEMLLRDEWFLHNSDSDEQFVIVEGRAGSGKSVLLQQLHHRLCRGVDRFRGPSLRLDLRWTAGASSMAELLARGMGAPNMQGLAESLSGSPEVSRWVWLLLDGLDELGASDRHSTIKLLRQWPGPRVLASRAVPDRIHATTRVRIPTLKREHAERVFVALGGSAPQFESLLGPRGPAYWPRPKETPSPFRSTCQLLAETVTGVSILVDADERELGSRQELLRRTILRQVERAEVQGRIDSTHRRWFQTHGLTAFGAVTWHMLDQRRGTIREDDIAWAVTRLKLSSRDADLLHRSIEALGITAVVGPAEWELTHRSLAEFCAARAVSEGVVEWTALLPAMTEPAASEILLHLSSFTGHAPSLIEGVLGSKAWPLSGLALATRSLREAPQGAVKTSTVVRVLRPQLRLATWFPDDELPGGAGNMVDIMAVMARYRLELTSLEAELIAVCHHQVKETLRGRLVPGASSYAHQANATLRRQRIAQDIALVLDLDLPIRTWLLMPEAREILGRRPRGCWARALVRHFDDEEPEVQANARCAWANGLPARELVNHIELLSTSFAHHEELLKAVLQVGSDLQQREALVRSVAAGTRFSEHRHRDDDRHHSLRGRLNAVPSERWLEIWEWAWTVGLLGQSTNSEPVERLYERFSHDAVGPARWRALVAAAKRAESRDRERWRSGQSRESSFEPPTDFVWQLTKAAGDPFRPVRVEAIAVASRFGIRLDTHCVSSSLVSTDDDERAVAWVHVLDAQTRSAFDRYLAILVPWEHRCLAPDAPLPEEIPRYATPDGPPHAASVRGHGMSARRELVSRFRKQATDEDIITLLNLLGDARRGRTAAELLEGVEIRAHRDLLLKALNHENPNARRFAADHFYALDPPEELIRSLAGHDDDEVAKSALAYSKRKNASFVAPRERQTEVPLIVPDEISPLMTAYSMPRPEEAGRLPVLDFRALESCSDIFAALDLLGSHSPHWKEARDMEGFHSRDGDGFWDYLASNAASENETTKAAIARALARLLQPEQLPSLVLELEHPLRGYWAAVMLAQSRPPQALLRAFSLGLRASTRAAHLAAGTEIAARATDAFIAALSNGSVVVPEAESGRPPLWSPGPRWLQALTALGGLEGRLRLLVASPPENVLRALLDDLGNRWRPLEGGVVTHIREEAAAWARNVAFGRAFEVRLVSVALRVLGRTGGPDDVPLIRAELEAAKKPPALEAALTQTLGSLAGPEHVESFLDIAERTTNMEVLGIALDNIAEHGDARVVEQLLTWIDAPPPAVQLAIERNEQRDAIRQERWKRRDSSTEEEPIPEELESLLTEDVGAWKTSAGRGVVLWGSPDQVFRLAHRLRKNSTALALVEGVFAHPEFRPHAEHALLVLGALENDPGEYAVPASVTGAGDEVYDSGVTGKARNVVEHIVQATSKEAVRAVFLKASLWDGSHPAQMELEYLGGPRPTDVAALLEQLEMSPDDRLALSFLAAIKRGEAELVNIWTEQRVAWWYTTTS